MEADPRVATFRALHETGCFVLPNPWDAGSACFLASMGFRALATTSAGLSFTMAQPDSPTALSRDVVIGNIKSIVDATPLPVSADLQAGYGATPEDVAETVLKCIQAGAAGLSIEDATGDPERPLYDLPTALARVRAARRAIDASAPGVVLTARAECFLVAHPDPLGESIRRLVAYADAGSDCLFAPGLRTPDEVAEVVAAVAPKPVNVLTVDPTWMTLPALADLGVRRISVGSALARVAWSSFVTAARQVATTGSFSSLADAEPFETFNQLFTSPRGGR